MLNEGKFSMWPEMLAMYSLFISIQPGHFTFVSSSIHRDHCRYKTVCRASSELLVNSEIILCGSIHLKKEAIFYKD